MSTAAAPSNSKPLIAVGNFSLNPAEIVSMDWTRPVRALSGDVHVTTTAGGEPHILRFAGAAEALAARADLDGSEPPAPRAPSPRPGRRPSPP